jgi:predicted secreted protein
MEEEKNKNINEDNFNDAPTSIEKPKKPRTEKQIEQFKKAQEKRKQNAKIKHEKINEIKEQARKMELVDSDKPKTHIIKEVDEKNDIVKTIDNDTNKENSPFSLTHAGDGKGIAIPYVEQVKLIKKAKKKPKTTIIYDESSTSSDEEVIIVKKKKDYANNKPKEINEPEKEIKKIPVIKFI